jgi:nitroimidazol reductase NimA-like FMN-containing flavoprotein (pyridoxamine 5'-phosphate oxidase superfamily)
VNASATPPGFEPHELTTVECRDLLAGQEVGRVAVCTHDGPMILPVNYTVVEDSVVFRTAPYGILGQRAWSGRLAFEVDHIDPATRSGWSVVAVGHPEMVEDAEELAVIRAFHNPQPWAGGSRLLYIRLPWDRLTGRRVGSA